LFSCWCLQAFLVPGKTICLFDGKEILETILWHQWAEPNLTRTQREPLGRERAFALPSLPSFLPSSLPFILLCICMSV
jgi:hypothetical protein